MKLSDLTTRAGEWLRGSGPMSEIVIGLDGGGTHTCVLAAELTGRIVAWVDADGSNPQHDPRAEANGRAAIQAVLDRARCRPEQVVSLVAGLAGLAARDDDVADAGF